MSKKKLKLLMSVFIVIFLIFSFFSKKHENEIKQSCGFDDFENEATILAIDNDKQELKIVIDENNVKSISIKKNEILPSFLVEDCVVENLLSLQNKGKTFVYQKNDDFIFGITVGKVKSNSIKGKQIQKNFYNAKGEVVTYWVGSINNSIDEIEIE